MRDVMVKESHLSVAHRVSSGSRAQRGKAVHEESRSVSHGLERWQAQSRSELVSNLFTLEEHRLHACFQILQRHQGEGPRAVECRKSVQVSEQSEEVHDRNENAVRRCVPRTDVTFVTCRGTTQHVRSQSQSGELFIEVKYNLI